MGYSFTNIQIRNTGGAMDCDRLVQVLTEGKRLKRVEKSEDAEITIAILPGKEDGWLTIASDLFEEDDEGTIAFARKLSGLMQRETLVVGCFDSDYLFLNLLDERSGTDAWAACGSDPGGEVHRRSNYTAWKNYVADAQALKKAMRRNGAFAEDCLKKLEPILSLPASQGRLSVELAVEEKTARCWFFALEEGESRQEPPRFSMCSSSFYYYHQQGQGSFVHFLNEGGPSRGVGVFFCGPVIDRQLVEVQSVSIQIGTSYGKKLLIPVELKEVPTEDGRRRLGGTVPEAPIPKPVPQGLSWKKKMDMESNAASSFVSKSLAGQMGLRMRSSFR